MSDLEKLTREDLDDVALDRGVPDPASLPNKEAVIAAIGAPNPALAVVEPEREPVEYEVVGPRRVHETEPGGTFTALLTAEQEAALIEGGHIKPTKKED